MAKMNIRIDEDVKEESEKIFSELGMSMTTAINLFLREAIRERGIPFELKLKEPNGDTLKAIEEGKRLLKDKKTPGYTDIDLLRSDLDV